MFTPELDNRIMNSWRDLLALAEQIAEEREEDGLDSHELDGHDPEGCVLCQARLVGAEIARYTADMASECERRQRAGAPYLSEYERGRQLVGHYPWRVTADKSGISFNGSAGFTAMDWDNLTTTPLAILRMICLCVNTYDDLVEALEDIAAFPDSECETDRIMRFRWNAVEAARAALAKAREAKA